MSNEPRKHVMARAIVLVIMTPGKFDARCEQGWPHARGRGERTYSFTADRHTGHTPSVRTVPAHVSHSATLHGTST